MTPKLGRLPRGYDPRIPHLSALRLAFPAAPGDVQAAPNWLTHIADLNSLGMFLNDSIGDCVPAGSYHALQILSSIMNHDGLEITEPDACALKAYEEVTGYNPADPATDNGTDMQTYLKHWLTVGIPTGAQAQTRHRCVAYVEVDPRNHADVLDVIAQCGFVYLGFNVPTFIMGPDGDAPLPTWDWPAPPGGDASSAGGHCVIGVAEMDANAGVRVISWGAVYQMTWAFWDQFVDEAYAVVDPDWANATGSPFGVPLATLAAQMRALATSV